MNLGKLLCVAFVGRVFWPSLALFPTQDGVAALHAITTLLQQPWLKSFSLFSFSLAYPRKKILSNENCLRFLKRMFTCNLSRSFLYLRTQISGYNTGRKREREKNIFWHFTDTHKILNFKKPVFKSITRQFLQHFGDIFYFQSKLECTRTPDFFSFNSKWNIFPPILGYIGVAR